MNPKTDTGSSLALVYLSTNILKQECIPVGCVPPAYCPYLPACTAQGGVYIPGGGGVPARGVYLSRYTPSPLWTVFLTHASENITLPQTSFAEGNECGQFEFDNYSSNQTCPDSWGPIFIQPRFSLHDCFPIKLKFIWNYWIFQTINSSWYRYTINLR